MMIHDAPLLWQLQLQKDRQMPVRLINNRRYSGWFPWGQYVHTFFQWKLNNTWWNGLVKQNAGTSTFPPQRRLVGICKWVQMSPWKVGTWKSSCSGSINSTLGLYILEIRDASLKPLKMMALEIKKHDFNFSWAKDMLSFPPTWPRHFFQHHFRPPTPQHHPDLLLDLTRTRPVPG